MGSEWARRQESGSREEGAEGPALGGERRGRNGALGGRGWDRAREDSSRRPPDAAGKGQWSLTALLTPHCVPQGWTWALVSVHPGSRISQTGWWWGRGLRNNTN